VFFALPIQPSKQAFEAHVLTVFSDYLPADRQTSFFASYEGIKLVLQQQDKLPTRKDFRGAVVWRTERIFRVLDIVFADDREGVNA
jgi:hypothetical protein